MSPCRIGIELEFMVAFHDQEIKRSKPKDDRWPDGRTLLVSENDIYGNKACQKAVCAVLASIGLPTARIGDADAVVDDPDHSDLPDKVVAVGGKRQLRIWNPVSAGTGGKEAQFNYWFVTHEASIVSAVNERAITVPAGYRWYSAEITSPILADQEELDGGLPTLRKALASIQNDVKVWLNSECGLHIHVSPLDAELDIVVARRLAALVFLLERPLLLQLCHAGRSKAAHARLISSDSDIAKNPAPSVGLSAPYLEEVIELRRMLDKAKGRCEDEQRTFQAVCSILSEHDCKSLGERLRVPKAGGGDGGKCTLAMSKFGTLEFRYPESSFDVDYISCWVNVVRRLFAIAAAPDAEYAAKLCEIYELATRDVRMGWINFATAIGLDDQASVFKKRIKRYDGDLKDLDKPTILPRVG
ncbi:hypothetical protein PLIIFM63780_007835 [Purpureocillium lilacinum]|uniref:Amidoligase enzyme domain-containing protein n=2 Tax=Purpureocillium lilacinum TaxID=33203 RepID=A0A179GZA8_PURLI|nr:hypothetical protein Purlil1_6837 [Purpureocillium lilacinum]OAQ82459.1 amidoligase enzyme domain-containing protein [Purpureocillium lilacinum]PWI67756.1 hypothetical protein PCL_02677 [Purpureocillium lilacinum]GJN84279.1 hypothetical protein PLIIFM63780_007835 [Purpureocillium lilacinum]